MISDQPLSFQPSRLWRPKQVLITPAALKRQHGQSIVQKVEALGIPVVRLPYDRLPLEREAEARGYYAWAKSTLAIVVAPPSKLKLQPIAPSADWRVDLAEGCPAHCSYCYLAGSLKGPPITRVYANLADITGVLLPEQPAPKNVRKSPASVKEEWKLPAQLRCVRDLFRSRSRRRLWSKN
jgi:spore photoproduct lyase